MLRDEQIKKWVLLLAHESDLFVRKPAKDWGSNGHSGIEVGSRNMTNSVNHDSDNQSPCHTYARKRDRPINLIHSNWATASKYHEIRTNDFCYQLQITYPTILISKIAFKEIPVDIWHESPINIEIYMDDIYNWIQINKHAQTFCVIVTTEADEQKEMSALVLAVVEGSTWTPSSIFMISCVRSSSIPCDFVAIVVERKQFRISAWGEWWKFWRVYSESLLCIVYSV